MLSEVLLKTTQVVPPIFTEFSSFIVENPEPRSVITVPMPGGPPGPDKGEMEVRLGVFSAEYSNEQLLPWWHDPRISFTNTTTWGKYTKCKWITECENENERGHQVTRERREQPRGQNEGTREPREGARERKEGSGGLSGKKKRGYRVWKRRGKEVGGGYYLKSFCVKHSLVAEWPVFVEILPE